MINDPCGVSRKMEVGRFFMLWHHGIDVSITNAGRCPALRFSLIFGQPKTYEANKMAKEYAETYY